MLEVTLRGEKIVVVDSDGGVWWPDDETNEELMRYFYPEEMALWFCQTEPMRGTWRD